MGTYIEQLIVAKGGCEKSSIGRLPLFDIRAKAKIFTMRMYQWVAEPESVGMEAAPRMLFRADNHGSSHRIEFDIPIAGQEAGLVID
jgi:hypothetical protein